MEQTPLARSPFGLDPDSLLYFGIALLVGAIIVILYGWQKFDESTLPKNDDDLITQFLPRDLASPREYSTGLLTYLGLMLALLGALSVLGPPVLQLLEIKAPTAFGAMPFMVALAMVGLLPNMPMLKDIETTIRRFAHRRAFIPSSARATAERLTAAQFEFSQYADNEVLHSDEMGGVKSTDFAAPRGSIEYNWARLCSLCYALRAREDEDAESLDWRLLSSYRRDLNSVYERRSNLQAQIAQFRADSADPTMRRELRTKIRDALQKLYVFIGCSVRLRAQSRSQIEQALKKFGFVAEPVRSEPRQGDVMIVGLAVLAASVFLVAEAAFVLGKLGWWTPSDYFPAAGGFESLICAFSAVLTHGAAILTADTIRRARLRTEQWFDPSDELPTRSVANYVRVGAASAAVGYLVLLAWGVTQQPLTAGLLEGAIPYALLPGVTGAFYAVHLDNVDLNCRPGWPFEILPQAIVTGIAGAAASDIWLSLGNPAWPAVVDFVILAAVMGFTVGASLAWYIPRNAVQRKNQAKNDPLRDVQNRRIQEVLALAEQRFGNPQEADRWLHAASGSLQGSSPIAALADVRNYEEVMRLIDSLPAPAPHGPGRSAAVQPAA